MYGNVSSNHSVNSKSQNEHQVEWTVSASKQHSAAEHHYTTVIRFYNDSALTSLQRTWTFHFYLTPGARTSYAVTYNANGGSGSTGGQTKWHDESLTLQSNGFSFSGYSFKRWNTASNDSGAGYNAGASYTGNGALGLYAIWNRTVSFNANGGSGAPGAQTAIRSSAITLSSTRPTFSGYAFKEWRTNADGTSGTAYQPGGSYAANLASTTLYAIWNRTVTYNANGGSGAPSAQTAIRSSAIGLSSTRPTWSGFTFKEWYTNANGTGGTSYQSGGSYPANNASVTLYAIWNHTVSFDANGGSGAPGSQTALKGSAITLSSTKPTRTNYVFKQWNTKSDGTGTAYNPGGSFAANTANTTLYAVWYAPYTVAFDANGGSGAPGSQVKVYNTDLALSTTRPTWTGYTFKRWNTSAADTGTAYSPGGKYAANANAVLYAIWNHTVTFNANYGTGAPAAQTALKGSAIALTTSKPTRPSHLFVKWNTASDGTGTDYQPGGEFAANTVNTTLYAMWEFYEKPTVTSLLCTRVDSNGDLDDEGTRMLVRVGWKVTAYHGATSPASIAITAKHGSTTTDSDTVTQFSGTVSGNYATGTTEAILDGPFDTEERYDVTVAIADALNTSTFGDILTEAFYPFDVRAEGYGAAFGKPAKVDGLLDVGYDLNVDGDFFNAGEQVYPTFVRSTWSTSSDESTLPVTPCFVLSTSDMALYYCSGA